MKRIILVFCLFSLLLVSVAAETLRLPSNLKMIESEAFYGDKKLDEVILPEGIEAIGAKAFANSSIKRIYLPNSLEDIAEDAFQNCSTVGYGQAGSVASYFFESKAGLSFEYEITGDYVRSITQLTSTEINIEFSVDEEDCESLDFDIIDSSGELWSTNYIPISGISNDSYTHISGILPGTYTGIVILYNSSYDVIGTSETEFTLVNYDSTPVGKPTVIFDINEYNGRKYVQLDWSEWAAENGENVTSYIIIYNTENADGDSYSSRIAISGTRTRYSLSSSRWDNSIVSFYVSAMNGMGESASAGPFTLDEYGMVYDGISFVMPDHALVGSEVTFTVNAKDAEKVRLVVDGEDTEYEATVNEAGYASVTARIISNNDTCLISFRALVDGEWTVPSASKRLSLSVQFELSEPEIIADGDVTSTNEYTISWNAVNMADGYSLLIQYPDGTEQKERINLTKETTSYTYPAGTFHGTGLYKIKLFAWAEGTSEVVSEKSVNVYDPNDVYDLANYTFRRLENETVEIVKYNGSMSDLILPPSDFSGAAITAISDYAFSRNSNIRHVIIPEGIRTIGASAFSSCTKLVSVDIPSTVTVIPEGAFTFCSALNEIALPEGLLSIGNSAFSYCESLIGLKLPGTLQSIGEKAFTSIKGLQLEVPSSVRSIGEGAFDYITSVFIPAGVTGITEKFFTVEASSTNHHTSSVLYVERGSEVAAFARANEISYFEFEIHNNEAAFTGAYWAVYENSWVDYYYSFLYWKYSGYVYNQIMRWKIHLLGVTIPNTIRSIGNDVFQTVVLLP